MTDYAGLLTALARNDVKFIVVGGVAAIAHVSARHTLDADIVYDRSPQNIERLVATLAPIDPYLRGAPPGLPFQFDIDTVQRGLNFTLTTSFGDLDLLGEIIGVVFTQKLESHSITLGAFGIECLCLDLEALIRVKRAAGRPKDLEAIAELEALLDERRPGNAT